MKKMNLKKSGMQGMSNQLFYEALMHEAGILWGPSDLDQREAVIAINKAGYEEKRTSAIIEFKGSPPPVTIFISHLDEACVNSLIVINGMRFTKGKRARFLHGFIRDFIDYKLGNYL